MSADECNRQRTLKMPAIPSDHHDPGALPLLLRIPAVMQELGSSRSAVYELIANGDLQTAHLGRAVRVTRHSLLDFVTRRTDPARRRRQVKPQPPVASANP